MNNIVDPKYTIILSAIEATTNGSPGIRGQVDPCCLIKCKFWRIDHKGEQMRIKLHFLELKFRQIDEQRESHNHEVDRQS